MSETYFTWTSAGVSLAGNVREINEDAYLDAPQKGLWAVADGRGGKDAGDVASRMVVDSLNQIADHETLDSFIDEVEDRLIELNSHLFRQTALRDADATIGSTIAGVLARGHHCLAMWAGDSRVYRCRDGQLERITRDHIEQQVILHKATGLYSPANVVTRAVGDTSKLFLDLEIRALRGADRYLICSSGLTKEVSDEEIGQRLGTGNCAAACSNLVNLALKRRCIDNVTAIVIQFAEARY